MNLAWIVLIFLATLTIIAAKIYQHIVVSEREVRVPVDQIELVGFKTILPYCYSPRVTGRIENLSTKYTLTEMLLQISIVDRVNDDFQIIAQRQELIRTIIPPGQAREVVKFIGIPGMNKISGEISGQYKILYAKGR